MSDTKPTHSLPPVWTTPATTDDLAWWLEKAPALEWTWATTYADFAPHWYVVHPRTPGMTRADFVRVGRIVRTFGEPGKFWNRTNLYLFTEDRRLKFWCMWGCPPEPSHARLVNLATSDRTYGEQLHFDDERLGMLRLGDEA